jgi:hypothetical protein
MKAINLAGIASVMLAFGSAAAEEPSVATAPPVVVRTEPVAGASNVSPAITEIRVTFSKDMRNQSWSWVTHVSKDYYPETTGAPRYLDDGRTCVLPVTLRPGQFYAMWINNQTYQNFQDHDGRTSLPYLLSFSTGSTNDTAHPVRATGGTNAIATEVPADSLLNNDQKAVLAWTDRQFRSFFDARTFEGMSLGEKTELETRMIDNLKAPQGREYFQAIGTLGALRSTNAVTPLRTIAFEQRDKNNRDRWMAVRALGLIGDKGSVPDLIHLVYHGNVNTRWWAQISLVRITGKNFGSDWAAWGNWWNESKGLPPYIPDLIRWWDGQPAENELAKSLAEGDEKFLAQIRR